MGEVPLYCAPQGGRTFFDRLKRFAPLGFTPQGGRSPPTALERPCSHADPNRLRPRDTPCASAAALLQGYFAHKKQPPFLGPYRRTMPRLLRRSWGGGAVSYERGTPVLAPLTCQKSSGHIQGDSAEQNHRRPPTRPILRKEHVFEITHLFPTARTFPI